MKKYNNLTEYRDIMASRAVEFAEYDKLLRYIDPNFKYSIENTDFTYRSFVNFEGDRLNVDCFMDFEQHPGITYMMESNDSMLYMYSTALYAVYDLFVAVYGKKATNVYFDFQYRKASFTIIAGNAVVVIKSQSGYDYSSGTSMLTFEHECTVTLPNTTYKSLDGVHSHSDIINAVKDMMKVSLANSISRTQKSIVTANKRIANMQDALSKL